MAEQDGRLDAAFGGTPAANDVRAASCPARGGDFLDEQWSTSRRVRRPLPRCRSSCSRPRRSAARAGRRGAGLPHAGAYAHYPAASCFRTYPIRSQSASRSRGTTSQAPRSSTSGPTSTATGRSRSRSGSACRRGGGPRRRHVHRRRARGAPPEGGGRRGAPRLRARRRTAGGSRGLGVDPPADRTNELRRPHRGTSLDAHALPSRHVHARRAAAAARPGHDGGPVGTLARRYVRRLPRADRQRREEHGKAGRRRTVVGGRGPRHRRRSADVLARNGSSSRAGVRLRHRALGGRGTPRSAPTRRATSSATRSTDASPTAASLRLASASSSPGRSRTYPPTSSASRRTAGGDGTPLSRFVHHIPSSTRPAAPGPCHVLPTFRWELEDEGQERRTCAHGKAVRVWLRDRGSRRATESSSAWCSSPGSASPGSGIASKTGRFGWAGRPRGHRPGGIGVETPPPGRGPPPSAGRPSPISWDARRPGPGGAPVGARGHPTGQGGWVDPRRASSARRPSRGTPDAAAVRDGLGQRSRVGVSAPGTPHRPWPVSRGTPVPTAGADAGRAPSRADGRRGRARRAVRPRSQALVLRHRGGPGGHLLPLRPPGAGALSGALAHRRPPVRTRRHDRLHPARARPHRRTGRGIGRCRDHGPRLQRREHHRADVVADLLGHPVRTG